MHIAIAILAAGLMFACVASLMFIHRHHKLHPMGAEDGGQDSARASSFASLGAGGASQESSRGR